MLVFSTSRASGRLKNFPKTEIIGKDSSSQPFFLFLGFLILCEVPAFEECHKFVGGVGSDFSTVTSSGYDIRKKNLILPFINFVRKEFSFFSFEVIDDISSNFVEVSFRGIIIRESSFLIGLESR